MKSAAFLTAFLLLAAPALAADTVKWEPFPSEAFTKCRGQADDAGGAMVELSQAYAKCFDAEKARLDAEMGRLVKMRDENAAEGGDKEFLERVAKAQAASEAAWKKADEADRAYLQAAWGGGSGAGFAMMYLEAAKLSQRVEILKYVLGDFE